MASLFSKNQQVLFLLLWMSIVPLFTTISISYYMMTFAPDFAGFVSWQWAVFFVLTVFTMSFAITPTTFIAILSGFFLGFQSLVPVILAYQTASIAGYYMAKTANQDFVSNIMVAYPKAKSYFEQIGKNDLKITLLTRISPALPFAIMNVVLSIANIRFSSFFIGGLIGMLPRTIFFLWVGTNAQLLIDALSQKQDVIWVIAGSLPVFWLMWRLIKPSR